MRTLPFTVESLTQSTRWDVQGIDTLKYEGWYLVNCNHQSWVDIFVLQRVLNRRIPMLKFFLKQQLIYVPVIGLAWWALDFPFMKRHGIPTALYATFSDAAEAHAHVDKVGAPIVVNGEIYGYVWIIADGKPLSELERMAVESGSTIAALMLLSSLASMGVKRALTPISRASFSPRGLERPVMTTLAPSSR